MSHVRWIRLFVLVGPWTAACARTPWTAEEDEAPQGPTVGTVESGQARPELEGSVASSVEVGFVAGLDYWPDDVESGHLVQGEELEGLRPNPADALVHEGEVWFMSGGFYAYPYDLETGTLQLDRTSRILRQGQREDSGDRDAIVNGTIRPCARRQAVGEELVWDEERGVWLTPHLGIYEDSIEVEATGESLTCDGELEGFEEGFANKARGATTDALRLEDCVERARATYEYSTCSLEGEEAWRCPLGYDADGDPNTEDLGACRWFLIYEGFQLLSEPDVDPADVDTRLFLAHGRDIEHEFRKYTDDPEGEVTHADARIIATQPHLGLPEGRSWASVPALFWDEGLERWRLYLTAEADEGTAQRYSESDDDGLTWGMTADRGAPVNCWDEEAGAFDDSVCPPVIFDEGAMPPSDPHTPNELEVVDASVIPWPGDDPDSERVLMIFLGADPACEPDPRRGSFLLATHERRGDQSAGDLWRTVDRVQADEDYGVIISPDRDSTTCPDNLHDSAMVEAAPGKFIVFFTPAVHNQEGVPDGLYVSASGFACSNGVDDDGDGLVDYGDDPDCLSPSDDEE